MCLPMRVLSICNVLVNKRLDEWVSEDRLDIERLQLPRKDSKVSTLARNSRPSSPDVHTPTSSTAPPPNKKYNGIGRKRKHESAEVSLLFWQEVTA